MKLRIVIAALAVISFSAVAADLPAPDADGWISLFNGKDLTEWVGLPGYWSVVDGKIQCQETKETSKQSDLILSESKEHPEKFA
ncbi:MAG TPA: family 16 glycoside hydrolase, partial [Verrucomicrobiae bacterium]|nr:family 16 glycoside hydrolase [Verrucomicrobiae bacterium]